MNTLVAVLLAGSIVLIQCLIGGTRLVYSLPAYGILAVTAILCAFRRPSVPARPALHCLLVSIVVFGYVLARAALSPVDYLWWTDFYMVIGCLTAYFLTAYYITDQRSRTVVLVILLALAFAEVGVGVWQFAKGDNWMPFGFVKGYGPSQRASGTLISSIHLAGYLEAVGIIAVSMAVWSTWRPWARILVGYVAIVCYAGVAITGSRGGYLSVAASFVAFAALSLYVVKAVRPNRFPAMMIAVVIMAVVAGGGALTALELNPQLQVRVQMMGEVFDSSRRRDVRVYLWQAALDQFSTAPALGTGAGTYLYYGRVYRRPQVQGDLVHAHGDYLEMLAEYGLIGVVGIAVFLFVHLRGGIVSIGRVIRGELAGISAWEPSGNNTVALQIGCLSAVAAYLAHSVIDFNLHIPGNALTFAFIFGVLASGAPQQGSSGKAVSLLRLVIPPLGLWMCFVGLPKLPAEYYVTKARNALRTGKPSEAIAFGEKAESYHRRNPELYLELGTAYRALALVTFDPQQRGRRLESAIAAFQAGLGIFPYDSHLYVRLGQVLDDANRFPEAANAYRSAMAYDPQLADVYGNYARHLSIVGRHDEAEKYWQRAKILAQKDLSPMIRGTSLDPQNQKQ